MRKERPAPLYQSGHQPSIEAGINSAKYTRYIENLQHYTATGIKGLRDGGFVFVRSTGIWFYADLRNNTWRWARLIEVYEYLRAVLVESYGYFPFWALQFIDEEARRTIGTSVYNCQELGNSPIYPSLYTKKPIVRIYR